MDATIGAVAGATVLILGAIVTAWVNLRKGVIEEWKEITDKLQSAHTACEDEVKVLREEISRMHKEMSAMRTQVTVLETERVKQLGEIRSLAVTAVTAVKQPDTEALAQALAPKLAEAMLPADGTKVQSVNVVNTENPIVVKLDPSARP